MTFTAFNLKLDWDQELPLYWFDNSPFKTHFMNSLSTRFFHGEKFFIDTFNKFKNDITDPQLKEQVEQFILQESLHRGVHRQFDKWLESKGYPIKFLETLSDTQIAKLQSNENKERMLLVTLCLEHLTLVFAEFYLNHPELLEQMHPHFRRLWTWHAIEEIEHKTVAHDLLTSVHNKLELKRIYSVIVTLSTFAKIIKGTVILLKQDKQLWKWTTLKDAWKFLFNLKNGVLIHTVNPYLKIMNKDFTPNDIDHTLLLSKYQK
jgi:predicted metal-dependent hydrolase